MLMIEIIVLVLLIVAMGTMGWLYADEVKTNEKLAKENIELKEKLRERF